MECRYFGLSKFWFVDGLVCRHFGLSTFWSVDVLVCRRFGLSTFRFVHVLVVDVSVCRRFDQLPVLWLVQLDRDIIQLNLCCHWFKLYRDIIELRCAQCVEFWHKRLTIMQRTVAYRSIAEHSIALHSLWPSMMWHRLICFIFQRLWLELYAFHLHINWLKIEGLVETKCWLVLVIVGKICHTKHCAVVTTAVCILLTVVLISSICVEEDMTWRIDASRTTDDWLQQENSMCWTICLEWGSCYKSRLQNH